MFNLIMGGVFDRASGHGSIQQSRLFEHTDDHIAQRFSQAGTVQLEQLAALPCLFMEEGLQDEIARVGQVHRVRFSGRDVSFEYTLDAEVPTLQNSMIFANREALSMPNRFEFSRNHWAVKDVDLYRFLLRRVRPRRQRPNVFQIDEHERIDETLASAMMPFHAGFNTVYESIREAAAAVGLHCRRADDIWENAAIIQDVVALIDRSRVVVCDCSGRNPNVFYEAGIAHTLGRDVILITQNEDDIPFDLRHLRHIRYLNNAEGRESLSEALRGRMQTIVRQ